MKRLLTPLALACILILGASAAEPARPRPNILFVIADDASVHYGEAYGCKWVHTPNIDRLARQGLVFDKVYTPTSKCAPSRAAILTGRNPWQLEDAANHQPYFPTKFVAFSEALAGKGVWTGGAGKVWGPGSAQKVDGSPRDFALPTGARREEAGKRFADFLKQRPADQPFFFWFGSHHPHRPYKLDEGLAAGKKPSDIDQVPAYWPDNETVRRDMLDYAVEVEAFDTEVGALLKALEEGGAAANTIVIVTSDHGMPFPRVKGHTYDDAHRVPFVFYWKEGIAQPGRRVAELISFIDLAPTFLELLKVDGPAAGMSALTGRSFTDLLNGPSKVARPFVLIGRERNDALARPGSEAGLGYPVRGIRSGKLLYVHNFTPDRWPCGNPDLGLKDTDNGPTKQFIEALGPTDPSWQNAFGKRPAEQLFDVEADPGCVNNLAADPAFGTRVAALRETLFEELKKQQDPRVLGQGDVFDNYPSPRAVPSNKPTQVPAR